MISLNPCGIPLSSDFSVIYCWDAIKEEKIFNVEKCFNSLFHCGFIVQHSEVSGIAGLLMLRCLFGHCLPRSQQTYLELNVDEKHKAINSPADLAAPEPFVSACRVLSCSTKFRYLAMLCLLTEGSWLQNKDYVHYSWKLVHVLCIFLMCHQLHHVYWA